MQTKTVKMSEGLIKALNLLCKRWSISFSEATRIALVVGLTALTDPTSSSLYQSEPEILSILLSAKPILSILHDLVHLAQGKTPANPINHHAFLKDLHARIHAILKKQNPSFHEVALKLKK